MTDIFISYSRNDIGMVSTLAKTLEELGYSVWWDVSGLSGGQAFAQVIQEKLTEAKCAIVVWSSSSVTSSWVHSEASFADNRGVLLTVGYQNALVPMPFNNRHNENLRGWNGNIFDENFQNLLKAIHRLCPEPMNPPRPNDQSLYQSSVTDSNLKKEPIQTAQLKSNLNTDREIPSATNREVTIPEQQREEKNPIDQTDSEGKNTSPGKKITAISVLLIGLATGGYFLISKYLVDTKQFIPEFSDVPPVTKSSTTSSPTANTIESNKILPASVRQQASETKTHKPPTPERGLTSDQFKLLLRIKGNILNYPLSSFPKKDAGTLSNYDFITIKYRNMDQENPIVEVKPTTLGHQLYNSIINDLEKNIDYQKELESIILLGGGVTAQNIINTISSLSGKDLSSILLRGTGKVSASASVVDLEKLVESGLRKVNNSSPKWPYGYETTELGFEVYKQLLKIVVDKYSLAVPLRERRSSYVVNKNGTIFSEKEQLLWMRCSVGQQWKGANCSGEAEEFQWPKAVEIKKDFAGYSDWRLPTREELASLVFCDNQSKKFSKSDNFPSTKEGRELAITGDDYGCKGKPVNDHKTPTIVEGVFPDTLKSSYWTSSNYWPDSKKPEKAVIDFDKGGRTARSPQGLAYVRLVRKDVNNSKKLDTIKKALEQQ